MKVLLKIFFENEAEYQDYNCRMNGHHAAGSALLPEEPATIAIPAPVDEPLAVAVLEEAPEDIPAPIPEPITCAYPFCRQPFNPISSEDQHCSADCKRKHRKMLDCMKERPARRGRPKITRTLD